MTDDVYELTISDYVLCDKEIEVLEDVTTLYSENFDKRVTIRTWASNGRWLVMRAPAIEHTASELPEEENPITGEVIGPAPLAQSFDTEEQARKWCEIQGLTIVPVKDKQIDQRYEL